MKKSAKLFILFAIVLAITLLAIYFAPFRVEHEFVSRQYLVDGVPGAREYIYEKDITVSFEGEISRRLFADVYLKETLRSMRRLLSWAI